MSIIKNRQDKLTYIGISLGGTSNIESAAAVLDKNLNIIKLDKLFSIQDVEFFLDNLPGISNSVINISIPENETMISCKWKYASRTYHAVNLNSKLINKDDWTNRFSSRGSEYLLAMKNKGIDIIRYDVDNVKKEIGYCTPFKNRTPIDCKAIQNSLKMKFKIKELPSNMLPVAQLEAILGAILAHTATNGIENQDYKRLYNYNDIEVLGFC